MRVSRLPSLLALSKLSASASSAAKRPPSRFTFLLNSGDRAGPCAGRVPLEQSVLIASSPPQSPQPHALGSHAQTLEPHLAHHFLRDRRIRLGICPSPRLPPDLRITAGLLTPVASRV